VEFDGIDQRDGLIAEAVDEHTGLLDEVMTLGKRRVYTPRPPPANFIASTRLNVSGVLFIQRWTLK
jgi:hypothetical protein